MRETMKANTMAMTTTTPAKGKPFLAGGAGADCGRLDCGESAWVIQTSYGDQKSGCKLFTLVAS
jgi:hypothetical protein